MNSSQPQSSLASPLEGASALSRWLFWLVVLAILSTVLVITYFYEVVDLGMYAAMLGLAVIMIVKGFLDVLFLDRETRRASVQVRLLERVHDFEDFLEQAGPSVFRSHIANLYEIAYTHPDVNQDNLLEILQARLSARNRVVELFSSILVTLGLVGTIVGLMLMMDRLQAQIMEGTTGGSADLMSRLFGEGGALVGLSTAFLTTLIGAVLGGVILRILTSVVDANLLRYVAHVGELTEVYVLPSLRRVAHARERDRTSLSGSPAAHEESAGNSSETAPS
ncbi:MAG: MotA/TolQ/ExbB proton channel family protein [Planctomycetota bacterium]